MPYLFAIALGGGALAAGMAAVSKSRRPTLMDALTTASRAGEESPSTLARSVGAGLARWDEGYQATIQARFDPWLAGRLRDEQMQALTRGERRHLGSLERRINRSLLLGAGALGLLALRGLTAWPLAPGIIAVGLYNAWPGLQECWRVAVEERRVSVLHVLPFYLAGLWAGGYYLPGTLGVIGFNLCQKVELLTQMTARHSLTHLLGEQPRMVWVLADGAEIEIPFERLRIGDILVLTAGQPVPIDGVIVQGTATVDEHRLTGEARPVEKGEGDRVLASTLVLGGRIRVLVEKTGEETAAGRIGEILQRTVEHQEAKLSDQFASMENTLLPMLAGSALGWAVGGPITAAAMLGCNYVLFSLLPIKLLTLLKALKACAGQGILVKDGRGLERLPEVDAAVFDKTGTLTLEQPRVARIHVSGAYGEIELLAFAAAAEQRQTHPIARAILAEAAEQGVVLPALDEARYELGHGLVAEVGGRRVLVGSERFMTKENLALPESLRIAQDAAHEQGDALTFVAVEDEIVGALELAATVRPEARATVDWLKRQGIALYILSGDQEAPTRKLAEELGMDGYFANTLPTQKAERIKALQAQGRRVCFVGDGINDAIALHQAEVSVSLRGATQVAADAAQIVLMEDDLSQLRRVWEVGQAYGRSISSNARAITGFSLAAAGGVLLAPAIQFWIVEMFWCAQFAVSFGIVNRSLRGDGEAEAAHGERAEPPKALPANALAEAPAASIPGIAAPA
jgi:Cu2+-exporting ATPase